MSEDIRPDNPLIIQSDRTILVEVNAPRYAEARDALVAFAELEKSPEHIHTYRVTPLSIWNARASGHSADDMVEALRRFAKFPPPEHVLTEMHEYASRYGRLTMVREDDDLLLHADDPILCEELAHQETLKEMLADRLDTTTFRVPSICRGRLKQALIKVGYPADDLAGYRDGAPLPVHLSDRTAAGESFAPRSYQTEAAAAFHAGGSNRGGSGVIVLPCGAGKTIVAMTCMAEVQTATLILATNVTAVRQWIAEILDKTSVTEDQIGEYSGSRKEIRPITVTTYQIMTYRKSGEETFEHLKLFDEL
ncbi:MAG: helicase-associated domain-containing protein, partial [Verrucomicrobiota bacterium]